MAQAIGAVYDPPGPGLPHVAVIVMDGDVIMAQAVGSIEEGNELLAEAAKGLSDIAGHFKK